MRDQPESVFSKQNEALGPKEPDLLDQVAGVFTSPVELLQGLNKAPSWGLAQSLIITSILILIVIWGIKVADPPPLYSFKIHY